MKKEIDEKTRVAAQQLMDSVMPIKGMMRTVYRCDCEGCGQLFLHHYIPFAIGRGARFNQCMCQLTANRMHLTTVILENEDKDVA